MTKADTILKKTFEKSWKKESGQSRRVPSTRMVERPTQVYHGSLYGIRPRKRRVSYHHPSSYRD